MLIARPPPETRLISNVKRHCLSHFERLSVEEQLESLSLLFFNERSTLFDRESEEDVELFRGVLFVVNAGVEEALETRHAIESDDIVETEILMTKPRRTKRVNVLSSVAPQMDALSCLYHSEYQDPLLRRLKQKVFPCLFQDNFLIRNLAHFSAPTRLLREVVEQAEGEFVASFSRLSGS